MFESWKNFGKNQVGSEFGNQLSVRESSGCCTSRLWADELGPKRKIFSLPKMKSNQFFLQINNKMDSLKLGDKFDYLFNRVSEHDRRIVNRMAMKRTQDIAMVEDAVLSRKLWEIEKVNRDNLIQEHNEILAKMIKERREYEAQETVQRLSFLKSRDKYFIDKLRDELDAKDFRLNRRLRKLEIFKEAQQNEKKKMENEKAKLIALNNEETDLNKRLEQQWIINQLENKIERASNMKQRYLQAQKFRLQFDNETEQKLHSLKLSEIKRFEDFRKDRLIESIKRTDKKSNLFLEQKKKEVEKSRMNAKDSAFLRDFIRRSITPVSNMMPMDLLSSRTF